nr:protein mini spindles [Halyomorpha halys]
MCAMDEDDYTKLTVEDACVHKVWKARLVGYEGAAKHFQQIEDEKSPEWNKYIGLVKKFVVDSHALCQEKGLEAVLIFVENCGNAGRTTSDVVAGIIQKCLAAPKARTRELAAQIILMYIEIEKHEIVYEEIIKGTESKNPKVAAASVHVLTLSLKEFGCKIINVNKLMKRIPSLLEDRDGNVRSETKMLVSVVYHWLGPVIKPQLTAILKPAQLAEVETEYEKVKAVPAKASRLLRSQQTKKIAVSGADGVDGDVAETEDEECAVDETDPYDLLEPVDILNQLNKEFYTKLESKKWSERKEVLEEFEKQLAATPKLEPADYGEMLRTLKKVISKDSNVIVVGIAIKCVTGIANGLKKKFHPYVPFIIPALFEKFKEKKQNIVTALREAVDAVYLTTSLEAIQEEIVTNLDNKNPSVKSEISGFLSRCFSKSTSSILTKKLLKTLCKGLTNGLRDQDPAVRDNSALALGTAMKVVGEKTIGPFLVEIDPQMLKKIKECCDKAEILVKQPTQKVNKVPKTSSEENKAEKHSSGKSKVNKVGAGKNQPLKKGNDIQIKPLDREDALTEAKSLFSPEVYDGALDMNPEIRLAAYNRIKEVINNLNVVEESGQALLSLLHAQNAHDTDELILCRLELLKSVAELFPLPRNDSAFLVECGRQASSHPDPLVRNAGLALIGTVHLQSDNEPLKNITSEKPQIGETFKRPTSRGNSQANREKDSSNELVNDVTHEKSKASDSKPKVDISNQITDQLVAELGDKNWKVRAEAVAKLQGFVNSAQSITSNLGEAAPVIAARISDSNTKISASAIALVESLAPAMGPSCKQYVRIFLPALMKAIGDPKTWIRSAVIPCLNTWGEVCGFKEFFEGEIIAEALKTGSPTVRSELWTWLADKLPNIPPKTIQKEELMACLPTLYSNLEDRNADVRKNACEAVLGFMLHLGFTNMIRACENIKGSGGTQVKQILEKTRGSLPVQPMLQPKSSGVCNEKSSRPSTAKLSPGSSATITKSKSKGNIPSSKSSTSLRKKEEENDGGPLLQVNSMKTQRVIDEQKLKTLRWNFVTPRTEFFDLLREQMTVANVNKTLVAHMFHNDFRYHIRAIDALTEDLPSNKEALISNLDLILRWMTLRFFDTNPSVLLKGLEYLNLVFSVLIEEEYSMMDSEASSFFPYLILKVGDPKDTVRNSVRAILKQISAVYPVSKQFFYVMEGLKSKNARQRSECLEQLSWLIENYGVSVCNPSPAGALKEIAKQIADRDTSVRNAALNCVVTAYFLEGEKTLKWVGQISEKDMSLLEERIKRAAKTRPLNTVKPLVVVPETEIQTETHALEPSPPLPVVEDVLEDQEGPEDRIENSRSNDTQNSFIPSITPPRTARVRSNFGAYGFDRTVVDKIECTTAHFQAPKLVDIDLQFLKDPAQQASFKPINMPKVTPTLSNYSQPAAIRRELVNIASSDIEKAMAAISRLDTIANSDKWCHLTDFIDQMVSQLNHLIIILNQSGHPEVVNCYRANFSLFMKVCNNPELCSQITEGTLYKIVEQLLNLLAEPRLERFEKQDMFVRVVNNLVIRLLENSNKTNILCALLKILYSIVNNPKATNHYRDLVVKCIWKLNKAQSEWDSELDYSRILNEFHIFLKDYPTAWWKNKEADVPLRTVKTVLHTMVKTRGTEVRDIVERMPDISKDSELYTYIKKVIKHLKVEEHSKDVTACKENEPRNIINPTPRISKETQDELSEIFRMIGDFEETSQGMKRLFAFKKSHPEADVQPFLSKATPQFQQYIRRGLQALEQQQLESSDSNKKENKDCESQQVKGKEHFTEEAELLWNRLKHLQEKSGCQVDKNKEEVSDRLKELPNRVDKFFK